MAQLIRVTQLETFLVARRRGASWTSGLCSMPLIFQNQPVNYQRAIKRPDFMFLEGTAADTTAGLSDKKNSHKKAGDIYN